MLSGYREPDELFQPERQLLEILAALELAGETLKNGKDVYARSLLEQLEIPADCYGVEALSRRKNLLLGELMPEKLAKICREGGMDVYEVIKICNKHPRVNILQPGPGVGGHCISVDPWFLVGDYPQLATVTAAAMHMNADMPRFVLKRVREIMDAHGLTDLSRVGLYGMAYKANVDDCRESPGLQLQQVVRDECGMTLVSYDPYVKRKLFADQAKDLDDFLAQTDLVVILVGHDEIRRNAAALKGKIILDCCNLQEFAGAYHL